MMRHSPWKAILRRLARGARSDDGFTLVELMIALVLAAMMFLALGFTLVAAMSGTADSRRNQQAGDFISERLEGYRSADYASVAMRSPLGVDSRIDATNKFDPGTGVKEPIIADPAGVVVPRETVRRDGTTYDIATYVTVPADSGGTEPYKRLTTIVTWRLAGLTHSRRATTYVAETQRGLPLPEFYFKNEAPANAVDISVEKGSVLNLFFGVTNLGARDSWTISRTGVSWTFDYYRTATQASAAASDLTALSGGVAGPIQTDETWHLLAQIPNVSGTAGGPYPITFRATSVSQPTVYKEITFNVTVTDSSCGNCNWSPIYLHNTTTSAGCAAAPCVPDSNRITAASLYADTTLPKWTSATAPDFDKNFYVGEGRVLETGGVVATEPITSGKVMEWKWDAPSTATTVKSGEQFVLHLYPKAFIAPVVTPTLDVQVLAKKSSGSDILMGSTSITLSGLSAASFGSLTANFTVNSPAAGGDWLFKSSGSNYRTLKLRITAPTTLGPAIVMAYDTTTYPAKLEVPVP